MYRKGIVTEVDTLVRKKQQESSWFLPMKHIILITKTERESLRLFKRIWLIAFNIMDDIDLLEWDPILITQSSYSEVNVEKKW